MRDPFPSGSKPSGGDLVWWEPRPGFRMVGTLDGVFPYRQRKGEFVKLTNAVLFRVADWKPITAYDVVAVSNGGLWFAPASSGSLVMAECIGTKRVEKDGETYTNPVMTAAVFDDADDAAR